MLDVKLSKIQHPKFVSIFCILVWKFKFWETRKFDETINSVKNHICVSRFYHVRVWVCVCECACVCVCIIHNGRGFFGFNIRTNICMVWGGYEKWGGTGCSRFSESQRRPPPPTHPPCMTQTPATRATTPCVRHESIYGWEWAMIPQSLTGSLQTNIQKMASKVANTIISFIRQISVSIRFYTTSSDWEKKILRQKLRNKPVKSSEWKM